MQKTAILEAVTWMLALGLLVGMIPARQLAAPILPAQTSTASTTTPSAPIHRPYDGYDELEKRPALRTLSPTQSSVNSDSAISGLPAELNRLYAEARKVAKEPEGNPLLAASYFNMGCFEFLRLLFQEAGLDLQAVLFGSEEGSQAEDGDLIKMEASIYGGEPHWGLYFQGQVYHNWGSFRVDPLEEYLAYYPLPGSQVWFFHPSFSSSRSAASFSAFR
ncbi:MAG: hypothetical protein NTV33_11870 [Coprothermobacterota bacterium]|nr:hypothetical protein [Coprothermobacterota bacterium]